MQLSSNPSPGLTPACISWSYASEDILLYASPTQWLMRILLRLAFRPAMLPSQRSKCWSLSNNTDCFLGWLHDDAARYSPYSWLCPSQLQQLVGLDSNSRPGTSCGAKLRTFLESIQSIQGEVSFSQFWGAFISISIVQIQIHVCGNLVNLVWLNLHGIGFGSVGFIPIYNN